MEVRLDPHGRGRRSSDWSTGFPEAGALTGEKDRTSEQQYHLPLGQPVDARHIGRSIGLLGHHQGP
jgi:hypothetical protein